MNAFIFFTCFVLGLNSYVLAGYYSTCVIEGLKDDYNTYNLPMPINDTFRGEIASFKTRNVLRMKTSGVKYLNATWEDQTLRLFTSSNYENYERETSYTSSPKISLNIEAICTEDESEDMTFKQPILDTNNHAPEFTKARYDYVFGMTIPAGLQLQEFIPITVVDYDITNYGLDFKLEDNEYFEIDGGKQSSYQSKEYTVKLTARKNITAPFNQTFTLTVTDNGHPVRSTVAPITIVVSTPEELEQAAQVKNEDKNVHPPIFSKHLYFGDYSSSHIFEMEEPIVIKYGAESTTELKQTGYEKYFKVRFEGSTHEKVIVDKLISLPNEIVESTDIITIEIEAVNEGLLHFVGRTAILIRLPNLGQGENSKNCDLNLNLGYSSNGYILPLILFLLAVFCIVFVNIYVMIMFVNKQKVSMNFQRS